MTDYSEYFEPIGKHMRELEDANKSLWELLDKCRYENKHLQEQIDNLEDAYYNAIEQEDR